MENCSVPYNGQRTIRNATVNHPDVVKGMAAHKEESARAIRQYVKEGRRKNKPGTTRALKHTITEEVHKDGLADTVKTVTNTKRESN